MTEAVEIKDDSVKDDSIPPISYEVTSYGSDLDVEGLVRRMKRGEILIPSFQRDYVWKQTEASRFIESLLLGVPVPGVFFANEPETNKFVVIDGQQRLKSLMFFYDGYFNPKPGEKRRKVFSLTKVQKRFEGKTYAELEEKDRIRLWNSIIHATIVKQTAPPGDDTSVFHIFERLNSGGRKLTAQEIRVALYHGKLISKIRELNDHLSWRQIFGNPNPRLKDQELILRFIALYKEQNKYARPMGEFLSQFAGRHRNASTQYLNEIGRVFRTCTDLLWKTLGKEAFRPTRAVNAAVFDSVMVGLARRLEIPPKPNSESVRQAYNKLLQHDEYVQATSRSTADEAFVKRRISQATGAFTEA